MDKQARITEAEIQLVRQVFSGSAGNDLLKILRKIFVPTYDFNAEMGENTDVFWMDLKDLARMTPQDREVAILARVKTIDFLEGGLERLRVVAGAGPVSTPASDSTK